MKTSLSILAVLALAACNAAAPTSSPTPAATVASPAVQSDGSFMFLLNAARAQNGLSPLQEDLRLARSAQAHAEDMQAKGYFSHVSPDGRTFTARARAAGYTCARAENIASGQRTPEGVMTAWMNSAGHRQNILRSNVTEYGVGRTSDYWVLMLGAGC